MTHRACASNNVASVNSNEFISLLTFIPQMKRMNRIENVAQISLKLKSSDDLRDMLKMKRQVSMLLTVIFQWLLFFENFYF
jgi:hypothetical protein